MEISCKWSKALTLTESFRYDTCRKDDSCAVQDGLSYPREICCDSERQRKWLDLHFVKAAIQAEAILGGGTQDQHKARDFTVYACSVKRRLDKEVRALNRSSPTIASLN